MQGETVGHYRIEEHIGSGAMGDVYRATDIHNGSRAAVKFMQAEATHPYFAEAEARFQREAQILHQLRHENIVQILGSGRHGEVPYLVMEYVDAPSLKQLVRLGREFSLDDIGNLGFQLLSGLGLCHSKGVVHRDIKPSNILIRPGDRVLLVDFGIARTTAQIGITMTGAALGTPAYMSPEQTEGKPVTPASDVWSVGVVLYELLTGALPFGGDNPLALMNNIRHTAHPDPSVYKPELGLPVDALLRVALAKEPWARFGSRGGNSGGSTPAPALEFQKALLLAIEGVKHPASVGWQQLPPPPSTASQRPAASGPPALGQSSSYAAVPKVTPAQQRQLDTLKRQMLQAKGQHDRAQLMLTQFASPLPKAPTPAELFRLYRVSIALALISWLLLFCLLVVVTQGLADWVLETSTAGMLLAVLVGVLWPWFARQRAEVRGSRQHATELTRLQVEATRTRAEYSAAQTRYELECNRLGVKP